MNLDEFAEKAKPIVSEILQALNKGEEVPHQNFGMNMFHWVVVAGDVNALNEMIGFATQDSPDKFVRFINQQNYALSVKEASYEGAPGCQSPAINGDTMAIPLWGLHCM